MAAWAIIVAIDQYHPLTKQPPLGGAVADATDFAEWALDPLGGNVPHENFYFWTFPAPAAAGVLLQAFLNDNAKPQWHNVDSDWAAANPNRGPTALEIVETGQRVGRTARDLAFDNDDQQARRLYLFMAGHGLRAKEVGNATEQTCFVADNFRLTSSNNVQGLVPCESFRKALLTDRFTEVLVFLDCCRLQTSRLQTTATPITDFSKEPLGVAWGVGNAAQDGMVAYETQTVPVRGAFSKTLTDGLRSCRQDNALHMEDLKQYVVANIAAHTTQGQVPSLLYEPNQPPGPLIVAGPPTGVTPLAPGPPVDATAVPAGTPMMLKDGAFNNVVINPPLVAGPGLIALPPLPDGLYLLEVVGSNQSAIFKHPGAGTVVVD